MAGTLELSWGNLGFSIMIQFLFLPVLSSALGPDSSRATLWEEDNKKFVCKVSSLPTFSMVCPGRASKDAGKDVLGGSGFRGARESS